jgi:protein-tyrosine phosphatase
MFDLHSHLLPEIDDGAADIETSLAMARAYVDQGVQYVACTPHILPGLYHNTGSQIRRAVALLQARLDDAGIPLRLLPGADNHMVSDFTVRLREGCLLTLADSPYVLVEPPHHVAPARLEDFFFDLLLAGYVPILTHPERLSWIESKYDVIKRLASRGVWMQITSSSLRGRFGRRARYWCERLLGDGIVHILATDAHNTTTRPPDLLEGRREAERRAGKVEAERLVLTRPSLVLATRFAASASENAIERRGRHDHTAQTTAACSGGGCAGRMFGVFSQ